jgi:hypothetical protein
LNLIDVMEKKFIEVQSGLYIVLIVWLLVLTPIFRTVEEMPLWSVALILAICLVVSLFFYRLKTEISLDKIKLTFGLFLTKTIDIKKIKKAEVVRNKWYYGWGIRYVFNGWMWNIYGLDAVELQFKDRDAVFKVGSQKANDLKKAIDEVINTRH